jgi:spore germination cell wall hydrolase CwlJ-like protein
VRAPRRLSALLALALLWSAGLGAHDRAKADKLIARMDADGRVPRFARVDRQPAPVRRELMCMALNSFHEARGSIVADRYGVMLVARNRADRDGATLCATVWEPWQFSWTALPLDRLAAAPAREPEAWLQALDEACDVVLDNLKDLTGGATNFYNPKKVSPVWAKRAPRTQQIGQHRYLRLSAGEVALFLPLRSLDTWSL